MTGNGRSRQQFGYVPALDGVRALAVVAVICFHAGFSGATGGFIGVSVFFTLSGFLITSLLIAEHNHSGHISLKGFYTRRVRRLLPASMACLGVVLVALPFWSQAQRRHLTGDALAALGNVFNWRAAFSTVSYRDLFVVAPSPLAHFWSLAIEEQCYLVLPIIVVWALRRGRSRLAATALVLLAASVVAAVLTTDFDVAYNGTHVRIAEVLVGMLLSVVMTYRRPGGAAAQVAGAVGLALLVAGTVVLDIHDQWLAHGGLVLVALASGAVIIGSIADGPVSWLLSRRPLVAVGKVSYGLYLFHWPLFLVLSPERTGWGRWELFGLRLGLLASLTVVSYYVLERPIRSRTALRRPTTAWAALGTAVAVLLAGIWALPAGRLSATEQLLADAHGGTVTFAPTQSPPKPTVLVVGSNPAAAGLLTGGGLDATVVDRVNPDCPVLAGIEVQLVDGSTRPIGECPPTEATWLAAIDEAHPALLVVSMGALDDGLVRTAARPTFPVVGDKPQLDATLAAARAELDTLFRQLAGRSVPVLIYWPADPSGRAFPLTEYILSVEGVRGVVAASEQLTPRVANELRSSGVASVPRILVLGDSTSLPFAAAIDRAAAGSVAVLWGGHEGCPFVRHAEYRASTEAGQWNNEWFTPKDCGDFATDVPPLLQSFRPDVVVIVAGGTEVTQQRYLGDPTPYLPGDPRYQEYHDSEMAAFMALIPADGPPVLVADTPPLTTGIWQATGMADPKRTAAWNAQIVRWSAAHPQLHVLAYADALMAYEAVHGSIRSDGLHAEVGPLSEVVRVSVLPQILSWIARGTA